MFGAHGSRGKIGGQQADNRAEDAIDASENQWEVVGQES